MTAWWRPLMPRRECLTRTPSGRVCGAHVDAAGRCPVCGSVPARTRPAAWKEPERAQTNR